MARSEGTTTYGWLARLFCSHIHVRTMAAVGLCHPLSDVEDPITSNPDMTATLLRSITPTTRTRAPINRNMGCGQRVRAARAHRCMPTTDSRALARSRHRSRCRRTGRITRDPSALAGWFDSRKSRRCDRNLMAASDPPGGHYPQVPEYYTPYASPAARCLSHRRLLQAELHRAPCGAVRCGRADDR